MQFPKLVRLDTVLEMTTLSVSTIYRLMKKGQFPKQIKITERSTRWVESEILDYIYERMRGRSWLTVFTQRYLHTKPDDVPTTTNESKYKNIP